MPWETECKMFMHPGAPREKKWWRQKRLTIVTCDLLPVSPDLACGKLVTAECCDSHNFKDPIISPPHSTLS